jgi:hypothetical protein
MKKKIGVEKKICIYNIIENFAKLKFENCSKKSGKKII